MVSHTYSRLYTPRDKAPIPSVASADANPLRSLLVFSSDPLTLVDTTVPSEGSSVGVYASIGSIPSVKDIGVTGSIVVALIEESDILLESPEAEELDDVMRFLTHL